MYSKNHYNQRVEFDSTQIENLYQAGVHLNLEKEMSENTEKKMIIHIPDNLASSLKREFDLQENQVEQFIISTLQKMVIEKSDSRNEGVFTEAETKEIEDDLKGLGYL